MRWFLFPSALALVVALSFSAGGEEKKPGPAPKRFDFLVREDIFAGLNGDAKALARGLKKCDDALTKDPKHAEALVWRGAARAFLAVQAFQKKKTDEGVGLWTKGVKDMDDAVALAPRNPGVLIP